MCFSFALCIFSMQSVQNLGLAVISIAAGALVDSHGYLILEIFFIMWLCCKFNFSIGFYLKRNQAVKD